MSIVFGISLGNSNCCIATNNKGSVNIVSNDCGERFTPSVVYLTDDSLHIGSAAVREIKNGNSIFGGMLHLLNGGPQSEFLFPLDLKCKTSGEEKYHFYELDHDDNSKITKPEDCMRHLLVFLKDMAASHACKSENIPVVFSLPGWTNGKLSAEITQMASSAGFNVLSTINQPTAACIGYQLLEDNRCHLNIVTLHCGGSSAIASLGEIIGGLFSIKDTSATSSVAGDAVTITIVDYIAQQFYHKYKIDPMESKRSRRRLFDAAEKAKNALSNMELVNIDVESVSNGIDFKTNLGRARFNDLASKVLAEFLSPVKDILSKNGLSASDIDKVVLSGGSCKIPKLRSLITNMFPEADIHNGFPPDEVLAAGAAKEAEYCMESKITLPGSCPLLTVLSVPIYICSGELNKLVFPAGAPSHYRQTIILKNPKTAILYESKNKMESPLDEQILAEIDFNVLQENCESVQIEFAIKPDGSLVIKMEEMTSKVLKTFFIGNEAC